MARNKGWKWTVIISILAGAVGASIFWLYRPYGHDQLAQQVAEELQAQPATGKGGSLTPQKPAGQAMGPRFQTVFNGKEILLVDLQNGRVWRYFHNTKEAGFSKEDEGLLPMPLYYAGQKHYSASEIEPPAVPPGSPPQATPEGKQPQ